MSLFSRKADQTVAESRPQSVVDLPPLARMWWARAWNVKALWCAPNPLKVSYDEAIRNAGYTYADDEARFFVSAGACPAGVWIDPANGDIVVHTEWVRRIR